MSPNWLELYKKIKVTSFKKAVLPIAIFIILLLTAYIFWNKMLSQILYERKASFESESSRIVSEITNKINLGGSILFGIKGYYESSQRTISPEEWLTYTQNQEDSLKIACVDELGYIKKINKNQLASELKTAGEYSSRVFNRQSNVVLNPNVDKDEYYIIKYITPLTEGSASLEGYDYSSQSEFVQFMQEAETSGLAIGTSIQKMWNSSDSRFDTIVPIYYKSSGTSTPSNQLRGFAIAITDVNKCGAAILGDIASQSIDYEVYDVTNNPLTPPFFDSNPNNQTIPQFLYQKSFDFRGRQWLIKLKALPQFGVKTSDIIFLIAYPIATILISFLISIIIFIFLTSRSKALKLVDRVTKLLQESESKLKIIFEQAPDAMFIIDDKGRFVNANSVGVAMHGMTKEELVKNHTIFDFISSDDKTTDMNLWENFLSEGKIRFDFIFKSPITQQDHLMEITGSAHFLPGLNLAIVRDVTYHRKIEQELRESKNNLQRNIRALKTLSACNEAMVRSGSEEEFENKVCNIIVNEGKYVFAWIGLALNDEDKSVKPVTWAGHESGYLDAIKISWGNNEYGMGPTGTAIKNNKPSVLKNVIKDPNYLPWRDHAQKMGYASSMAVPIIFEDNIYGVLNIYSDKTDAFNEEEVELFSELANDIGYGSRSIRIRSLLKISEARYRRLFEAAKDGILILDYDSGRIVDINPFLLEMVGFKFDQIVGKELWEIGLFKDVAASKESFVLLKEGGYVRYEDLPLKTKGGKQADVEFVSNVYDVGDRKVIQCNIRDITQRKIISDRLKVSEERYKQMFLNLRSAVAVYKVEDDGNRFVFEDFNPAAEKIEGITKQEVIGKDVTEVFPGSIKMGIVDVFKEVYKTGKPRYFPESLYANGHQSWRENYIYKLPNDNVVAIYNEITEEVERKNKLKESEERYKGLVNFSPDAILVHTDMRIVFANPSAIKLLGAQSDKDIIGKMMLDFVSQSSRDVVKKRIAKVLAENVGVPLVDEKFVRIDGSVIDVSVITAPLIYGGKKSIQIVLHDISERKLFENRIQKINSDLTRFKLAVQNASDHIIITDIDGKILYANPAASKITGYSIDEMVGNSPRLWGRQMPPEFYKNMWKVMKEDKKSFTGEITNKRKSGELYQAVTSISPVLDELGNIIFFVGIERDVTKEKAIDKAKSEFVSLASHQLRTPLSVINWYTEMLMDEDVGKLNKKQKDYLGEIYHSSKRMADLVGSLLNVSRIEMGTFAIDSKPTDITEISKSVIKELDSAIRKRHHKVVSKYDKEIGQINIDQSLMRIVFQNLISNAVKYTPSKGKINVEIHKVGNDILFSVADNGYGIPESQQSRVFEKFFRADNIKEIETDGTGLGLYIVKEIVDKSGGTIRFESKEGKGTTFFVSIPITGMVKRKGIKGLM